MRFKKIAIVLLVSLLLSSLGQLAWSQALQNAITGQVQDQRGAVVAGAKVTTTNTATNVSRVTVSDSQGNYTVTSLVVGSYTVRAESPSFKAEVETGIVVQANKATRVDFSLSVGNVSQSVEVKATGAAPIIRTEDAALGAVLDETQVSKLPVVQRDFVSLAQMVPGANGSLDGNQNDLGRTQALNLSVNGQRQFDNNYRLDGVSFIDAFVNGSSFVPALDVISEVSVLSGQYSAAYGEYSGAQINMVTKSGTNKIHGSAFEYFQNDVLNARSFFDVKKPPLRYNQFGVTIGGPIVLPKLYNGHNRTFFFFGYQGDRLRTRTTFESTVATAQMRAGDFSQLLPTTVIVNPFTGVPFPNNVIPSGMVAPQATKLLKYVPLPNLPGTGVNFVNTGSNANNDNQYYARLDHNISQSDTLFVRTAYRGDNFRNVTVNPNFGSLGTPSNQNYVISESHVFSARFLNQAEVSYVRQSIPTRTGREGTNIDPLRDFGIAGLNFSNPLLVGIPTAAITGYLGTGENFANPRLLYSAPAVNDNATLQLTNHILTFGAEFYRRRQDFISVNARNQGTFDFTGQLSGNSFADFTLGLPFETEYQPEIGQSGIHQRHFSTYLQDDWRIARRLTLNLGLRYEYSGPYSDVTGHARNLDWATLSLFPAPGVTAPLNDPANRLAPRFGLAYRASEKTVVRTGFGIFTTTPTTANVNLLYTNPPVNASQFLFTNLAAPNLTLANLQTGTSSTAPPALLTIPKDYGPGYSEQWSLNVQRQLPGAWVAEIGYVGSHTLHLDNALSLNEPPTPGPGTVQSRRPIQQYADIRVLGDYAVSYYQGLDARVQTANWHGLNLLTSYTWSHCIDTGSDAATSVVGTDPQEPQNEYDRLRGQRGRCVIDFRKQYHLNAVYPIRVGAGLTGVPGVIVKGWSASVNGLVQSGDADTVTVSGNPANTGRGTIRPNRICDGNLPGSQQTYIRFFDTSCFVSAGNFAFGDSGRGVITGPATHIWNFSAIKEAKITESQSVQFRADFFNSFNNPHFGDPGLVVGTTTFGRSTTAGPGRQIQLGLRYDF
jgi:hypothetical protein